MAKKKKKNKEKYRLKKTVAEKMAEIPYDEVQKITNVKKLENMFKVLQQAYAKRKKILDAIEYSPAVEGMEEYRHAFKGNLSAFRKQFQKEYDILKQFKQGVEGNKEVIYKAKLRGQINEYQKFFRNKTSTVRGQDKWLRRQDEIIFGTTEQTLSRADRKAFWGVYNEYKKNGQYSYLDSDQIIALVKVQYINNVDLTDLAKATDMITATYTVETNAQMIMDDYNHYIRAALDELGVDSGDELSQADWENTLEAAMDFVVDQFPAYEGNTDNLKAEIERIVLRGGYGSGRTVYSGDGYD